ncbi:putative calcium-binding protein CML21, partial [Tetrabaena socialis]
LTWVQFKAACNQSMGLDQDSVSLKEVFALPDVDDSMLVSYGDFILIVTTWWTTLAQCLVVYMMDSATKRRTIASQEVRACLELMEKSFMFFDSSADGCIERKELAMALKSGTRVFGRKASKSLADQLFDQLDWSRDGNITFKEWLIGMERIIIEMMDDEDEDEIEADEEDEDEEGEEGEEEEAEGVEESPKKADRDEKEKTPSPTKPAVKPAATDEVRPFTRSGSGMAPQ